MAHLNGGILPMVLLCAAFGLVLSAARPRAAWAALGAFAAMSLLISLAALQISHTQAIMTGLLLSVIGTTCLVFLLPVLPLPWAIAIGINNASWLGAAASVSSLQSGLAVTLPLALIFVPAGWCVRRGYGIAIKVLSSWLLAIATLAIFVSLVPTPGYEPDHME